MKNTILLPALLLAVCTLGRAQQVVRLYEGRAPGSENWKYPERTDTIPGENMLFASNITDPTLTIYKAKGSTGVAMIVCPGGAFRGLAIQHEGADVATWLNSKGITALVLKYRVLNAPPDYDRGLWQDVQNSNFARVDSINMPIVPLAVADGKEAVRYARKHAAELGIDADRIGMIGFSAGGTLIASVAQTYDADSRPDFVAPIYAYTGAILGGAVRAYAPPMFLACAADDPIAAGNPDLYQKWHEAGVNAELHVYANGGHGFGIRRQGLASDMWIEDFESWLDLHNLTVTKQSAKWRAGIAPAMLAQWKVEGEQRMQNDWPWLHRYEAANHALPKPKSGEKRVVFMGNSITEFWSTTDSAFFAGKPYVNRGISGQTTPQMLLRFRQDVIDLKPAVVVIKAGINDIAENTGPTTLETTFGNIASMAELAKANGIRVVLCSVLPAYDFPWSPGMKPAEKVVQLNALIKKYAQKNGCIWVDYHSAMKDERNGLPLSLADDGVHPSLAGYKIMEGMIEKAIAEALK
ncbi:MAG TPA: GDSL-type esterase/lipase family protein [Saprospiraceae bacterium]|nr:GDSL-type esterase/lipase family protein [Saprospiraceae bacterium]HPI08691.1 GDSL-type esterase/lipase family protein [Saprospiraceae bacterium]